MVYRRKSQYADRGEEKEKLVLRKPFRHEQFHACLAAAKQATSPLPIQERDSFDQNNNSSKVVVQVNTFLCCEQEKLTMNPDEPLETVKGTP